MKITSYLALGLWFSAAVVRSMRAQLPSVDRMVFKVSTAHLSLLYLAMLVDLAIG